MTKQPFEKLIRDFKANKMRFFTGLSSNWSPNPHFYGCTRTIYQIKSLTHKAK